MNSMDIVKAEGSGASVQNAAIEVQSVAVTAILVAAVGRLRLPSRPTLKISIPEADAVEDSDGHRALR